jgi:sensor histidine kinase regulating citrate/malate metabolism
LYVNQLDLAILIGNTMDNAIEACMMCSPQNRSINFSLRTADSQIFVHVENQFNELPNAKMETTKEDKRNHGFGLRKIDYIVQKYNGDLMIDINKDKRIFTLDIMMNNIASIKRL